MQIHGGDIYSRKVELDFSINLNPLGMPEEVRQAAMEGVNCAQQYPDTACRLLREAVSRAEDVPEDQIIFGNGAAELIFQIVQAVRPRNALLISPGFAEYERALRACGARIEYYDCAREQDFVPGEDFLKRITNKVDMIFLCNPNNPTGVPIPHSLLQRIAGACHRTNTILVVDECFNGLWPDGGQRTMKPYLAQMPQLFVLKAFTKLYAMAGLRLGYGLCANRKLLERMSAMSQPWNISIPAQMAGTAAMQIPDYEAHTREVVAEELAFLKKGFDDLGIRYWNSEANYLFFEGPPDLAERCLEKGILLRSCDNYRGLDAGYFRAAVRSRVDNEALLRVLAQVDRRECADGAVEE